MPKTMANYRAELVDIILNDEDISLSEQSARADVARMSNKTIFELLKIAPDNEAIAAAEAALQAERKEQTHTKVRNARYEQLSKLSGVQRIAALLNSSDNTGSILPASERSRLQSGNLTGRDRLTAIFNSEPNKS
ncbi:hypothetical protein ACBZ91_08090 [Vibrio natriegens]|uniref:hypothetical protein n=1 Tax=Vibrio natriegens TaxID=691 RepID=UPI003558F2C3